MACSAPYCPAGEISPAWSARRPGPERTSGLSETRPFATRLSSTRPSATKLAPAPGSAPSGADPTGTPSASAKPSLCCAGLQCAGLVVLGLLAMPLALAQSAHAQGTGAQGGGFSFTGPAETAPAAVSPSASPSAASAPPVAPSSKPASGTVNLAPINVEPAKPAASTADKGEKKDGEKKDGEKATPRVSAGLLECRSNFAAGTGFGSSRKVTCEFRSARGINHYYSGTLERVGLDLGVSDQASMLWAVLSTSPDLAPGALSGVYLGVTSGFALGPGFSANMLAAKDPAKNVTLQPLSVSADSGLSISLAAATLTLDTAQAPKAR